MVLQMRQISRRRLSTSKILQSICKAYVNHKARTGTHDSWREREGWHANRLGVPDVIIDIAPMLRPLTQSDSEHTVVTEEDNVIQHSEPLAFPRFLERPEHKEIAVASITALEPELEDMPLEYIRDGLRLEGLRMIRVVDSVRPQPVVVGSGLPKEISVFFDNNDSDAPTHVLAIYDNSFIEGQHVICADFYPIHALVLASHCAHLPPLTPNRSARSVSSTPITLPVVALGIPCPETFPTLICYLYSKRTDILIKALLPSRPEGPRPRRVADDVDPALAFALTYTCRELLTHVLTINGLWRNVVELGIFDEGLWHIMDYAWEVALRALEISTSNA